MRILFIGGTGFIGPHVLRRLVTAGHEVTMWERANPPEEAEQLQAQYAAENSVLGKLKH